MNSVIWAVVTLVVVSSPTRGQLGTIPTGCRGPTGSTVPQGSAWVAQDGCNVCTCTQWGVECQTWMNCNNINHLGDPGDPLCVYAESQRYTVGQAWQTRDGCNRCQCTAQGMKCTANPCSDAGFAQPKPEGSIVGFMDCPYHDRVYRYGDHFMADDGCNTCYCIMPGNYATFPACTTTPCDLLG